jgi:tape measure domain-containing protein
MAAFTIPTIFTAIDKMSAPLAAMSGKIAAFAHRADRSIRNVGAKAESAFSALTGGMGNYAIVGAMGLATLAVKSFVTEAAKIEDVTAYFTPVLGSAEKARKLVSMLNIEAQKTPFEFQDISNVASTLLPLMNGNLEKTVATFRMLGDTAGGNVDKLQRVTLGYSKALLKGKVTLESLNIIAEAGVPIFQQMAKEMYGNEKATDKLFAAISKGNVPLSVLTKSFETMTSKGGMFYRGMIISSETFNGVLSSLSDGLKMAAAEFGTAFLPILKEYALKAIEIADKVKLWAAANKELISAKVKAFITGIAKAVEFLYKNFDTVVMVLKVYIGLLLFIKTISFGVAIYQSAMAFWSFATAIWGAVAAVWAFLWPVLLVLAAIGLIVGAFYLAYRAIALVSDKWNEWGAALTYTLSILAIFFSPILAGLGATILLVKSFISHWDRITEAFTKGGFMAGIKAIGMAIIDSVLMPLQQVLKIIANLTGFEWAANASKSIDQFRNDIGVKLDAGNTETKQSVNPELTRQESFSQRIIEQTNNSKATLDINNNTDKPMKLNGGGQSIRLTSTWGQ